METERTARTKGTATPGTVFLEVHNKNVVAQSCQRQMENAVATGNQGPDNLQAHTGANAKSTTATQALQQEAERHLHPTPDGKDWDERLSLQTKSARGH
jgi:hypothetical protein